MGSSMVITAGRPTPQGDQSRQRGEGVAIVLRGPAIEAWRNGGDQQKSWGSRLLKITLDTGQKAGRLHILSCYAPTYGASREAKTNVFNHLQEAMNEIQSDEPYLILMLGDFNARVGSRHSSSEDDPWEQV